MATESDPLKFNVNCTKRSLVNGDVLRIHFFECSVCKNFLANINTLNILLCFYVMFILRLLKTR